MADPVQLTAQELERIKAETRKLDLETKKIEIDLQKAQEEVAQAKAVTLKLQSDARLAEITSIAADLDLKIKSRSYDETVAADRFNHTYYFTGVVTEQAVEHCRERLTVWDRIDPNCDIEIIFCSVGGDFIQGMHLYDFIRHLSKRHKITTGVLGQALSMASVLLQAGDVRWVGKESYVMIHEISSGTHGKASEVADEAKLLERMGERVLGIFADRAKAAGEAGRAKDPISKTVVKRNWTRKDWYLTSDECVNYGIADEIR